MLRRTLALPLAVALLGGAGACTSDDPAPAPRVEPVPFRDFDGRSLELSSGPFCDRVDAGAVESAVGSGATAGHWRSGDTIRVTGKERDVAHENGCQWTGSGGDVARAWTFVPPVTVTQARSLVRDARRAKGCTPVTAHGFGAPATGTVCTTADGREAAYRGLFGDVWLICAVIDGGGERLGRTQLLERAGDWCVAAATAASSD